MNSTDLERLFTAPDGAYRFARWGRPVAPVVFGVADQTLGVIKGAIEAVMTLANHELPIRIPSLVPTY